MGRLKIDVERARELRAAGLSWRKIADQLTEECGRSVRWHPISVAEAIRRADREKLAYAGSEKRGDGNISAVDQDNRLAPRGGGDRLLSALLNDPGRRQDC